MSPVRRSRVSGSYIPVDVVGAPDHHVLHDARYNRRKTPRAVLVPKVDVRLRRELAQRRLLIAIGRHVVRIGALHLTDGLVTAAAFMLAAWATRTAGPEWLALQVGFVLLGLESRGAYKAAHARRDPVRVVTGVAIGMAFLMAVAVLTPSLSIPWNLAVVAATLTAGGVIVERHLVDLVMQRVYSHGVGLRRAVLVGNSRQAKLVIDALQADAQRDHLILGHVTLSGDDSEDSLGTIDELENILVREEPAELIVAGALAKSDLRHVSNVCGRLGVTLLAMPSWNGELRGWAEPVHVGPLPAFCLHPRRLEMPALLVKRTTDVILTSLSMIVVLPFIALLAIAIKLDSRGPIFFRQVRVGLAGNPFMLWKLRSMSHESAQTNDDLAHMNAYGDPRLFKTRHDPRITRVGRFLRRFSLDELPQLFNVLAGDMSLVGPRPPLPSEVAHYAPEHFVRLSVVPGVTGPWQTSGRNLITDFEEVVRLERAYIEKWSLGLDLQIIARTIGVMLSGKGAY